MAGRGFGKTRTGAETILEMIREGSSRHIAFIGETLKDAHKIMIQGISGLLNCAREKVIYKQKAAREVLKALRENAMVAILIDQNVLDSEAVFVDFFGKKAATTPGLATFYLRTQSPIIPVFSIPTPDHKRKPGQRPPILRARNC